MKARRTNVPLKNTMRVVFAFIALILSVQLCFSLVYILQARESNRQLRRDVIDHFSDGVAGYYSQARTIARRLHMESSVLELGYRDAISGQNYVKIYNLVRALQANAYANERYYEDVFVYFLRTGQLYNQAGRCDQDDAQSRRYVQLDIEALLELPRGVFLLENQTVRTAKGAYTANLVGYRGERDVTLVACSEETVTKLADDLLKNTYAQAAWLLKDGRVLAASSELQGMGALDIPEESRLLKDYSFERCETENGDTLVIGFSRDYPNGVIQRNTLMVILVNAVCLLALAIYVLFFNRKLIRPLQGLLAEAREASAFGGNDEFASMRQWIDRLQRETADLASKYQSARRSNQLSSLTMGLSASDGELLTIQDEFIVLSVVCENDSGEEDAGRIDGIRQWLRSDWEAQLVGRQDHQWLFLISLPDGADALIQALLVEASVDGGALFALSDAHRRLEELRPAMEEASGAMMQKSRPEGADSLAPIYVSDGSVSDSLFAEALSAAETRMRCPVEAGNLIACRETLDQLYAENQFSPVFLQRNLCYTLLRMLVTSCKHGAGTVSQESLLRIRSCYRFDVMWKTVVEQCEQMLSVESRPDETWNRIEAFVAEHYADPEMSLQSVANHVNLSYSYLSKYFKSVKGVGFADYVNSLRIDEAKRLLVRTELPVGEILSRCGFSVFSSFTRAFKKTVGTSPSEYRESFRKNGRREL